MLPRSDSDRGDSLLATAGFLGNAVRIHICASYPWVSRSILLDMATETEPNEMASCLCLWVCAQLTSFGEKNKGIIINLTVWF